MPQPAKPRLLQKGMDGDDVRDAQRKLNFRPHLQKKLDEDGRFGDETDKAVRDFQRRNGLGVDGRIGDITWGALNTLLAVAMVKVEPRGPIRPLLDDMIDRGISSIPPQGGISPAWRQRVIERYSRGPFLKLDPALGISDIPDQVAPNTGDRIYQVQGQFGRAFSPWRYKPPNNKPNQKAPDALYSLGAVVAMTWRSSNDDKHIEHGPLLQVNRNYADPKYTATVAYQVLWADLWHLHRYHLASLYFQPSFTTPDMRDWTAGGALGWQASIDLGGENCNIFVQGQLTGSIDLKTGEMAFGAGVVVGATVNIPSSKDDLHWNLCKAW
jgi:hypothetical protein